MKNELSVKDVLGTSAWAREQAKILNKLNNKEQKKKLRCSLCKRFISDSKRHYCPPIWERTCKYCRKNIVFPYYRRYSRYPKIRVFCSITCANKYRYQLKRRIKK